MSQVSIFKLPNECFYTIMKYIKRNCERERPLARVDLKYDDLISFAACCQAFNLLLSEWDTDLSFKLTKYVTLKTSNIYIDFEKTYARLKDATARDKEAHWRSLSHAIRSSGLTEVALRYAPESFYADHMDAFNTVLSQLQKKQNLKGLNINVPAYTLEGLGGLASLETLRLDIRMDIDDLIEICRCNKNLRVLEYMNNETGGKRLAAIAPHCQELEELTFKMRPDCDASEYRNFAKIPKLQHLTVVGVHEKGTLQPLLEGFACNQSTILNRLFVVNATLDQNETQAMVEIETLTQVKCGFDDTQSIGLLSQLSNLDCLKIQSKQEFGTFSDHILSILMKSKVTINIDLFNWSISYGASGELSILMTDANANPTDCSPLSSLPGLTSYQVHGLPRIGLLQPILNGLALRQAPTLTDLLLKNITAEEIATVSEIASLSRLKCGFAETKNIELLARLPVLKKLTILCVPCQGSLRGLLATLASRPSQTLRKFCLSNGNLDSGEAKALVRLRSLCILKCQFADPLDIQLLSQLPELNHLYLNTNEMFSKISPGVLPVLKYCKKLSKMHINCSPNLFVHVDMRSSEILVELLEACRRTIKIAINGKSITFNGMANTLHLEMDFFNRYNLAIEPLARLESVNHMEIEGYHKAGSLRQFFADLAVRINHNLQSLSMSGCPIDFTETTELAKITSLTSFEGSLCDEESFQHLLNLSHFNVAETEDFGSNIVFHRSAGSLTLMNRVYYGKQIVQNSPAILQNLRFVKILGYTKDDSMHQFFDQLATWHGDYLQSLTVLKPYEMSNADLREVSRMKSLRILDCALSQSMVMEIEQLAQLPKLEVLAVQSHRKGSLKKLLEQLAAKQCPTLEHLAVRAASFTPQEVTQVAAISSLKRLECVGLDTLSIEGLAESVQLGELAISSGPERASLEGLFRALSLKSTPKLKNLILEYTSIDLEEARHLVQIDSITSLQCGFKDEESFSLLANMTNLESLQITSEHEFSHISEHLLDIFRSCRKLKTFDVGDTDCNLCHEFLKSSLEILKSVRNCSTQGPLELRISLSSFALRNKIKAIDRKYFIVKQKF